jgi:NADH:ubiquinone oxidoreductase subunit F (NADH-binding)
LTGDGGSLPRVTAGWQRGRAIGFEEHLAAVGPAPVPEKRRRHELIAAIERSGLLGRGGAGFPAAAKMRAVAGARRGRRVMVANGAEGEPASRKDQALLTRAPHLVLDGAVLSAAAVGAGEVILCIKRDASAAVSAAALAIGERGSSDGVEVSVVEVPAAYLAGEESALVNYLNSGRATPTFVPPRPFERGLDGRPTLIQNVETLAHLALIARHGADWFRDLGAPDDPGSTLVTLCGAVAAPGVYEVPSGVSLGELVEHAGGPSTPIRAFLVGGYAGSWLAPERALDQPLDRASRRARRGKLGAGVVVALPATACGVCETARVARFLTEDSAGQCGPCVHGLGSIADALEEISEGTAEPGTHLWIEKWADDVAGRGACGHPDGVVRFVASALATFRDEVLKHESGTECGGRSSWILPLPEHAGAR